MIRHIEYNDFDLYHTLISGQTFEWFQDVENPLNWNGILDNCRITITQVGSKQKGILTYSSTKNLDNKLIQYFGLDVNYKELIDKISFDDYVKITLDKLYGLRVIKQDPWYSVNAFIISQNNTVNNIKNILKNISYYVNIGNLDYYDFPNFDKLKNITYKELCNCKTGYRALYLLDLYNTIKEEPNFINSIKSLSYFDGKEKLMKIKGIGEKVADCILLYGYGKYEAYPLDVHLRRATLESYFSNIKKQPSDKALRLWAKDYWKDVAGFAHFFLFTYRRLYGEILID